MVNTADPGVDGFILTRQWFERSESRDGLTLVLWLSSASGPVRVELTGQEAVSFFPSRQRATVESLLRSRRHWRISDTRLLDFSHDPVAALYLKSQRQLFAVRDELEARGVHLQEADIKPTDRFLMERFITGAARVTGAATRHPQFSSYRNPRLCAADFTPAFSALSIDIETDYRAEQLYSIAAYSDRAAVVLMIGESSDTEVDGTEPGGFRLRYFASEAELLCAFSELLQELDPDILMGWNVVNFDLRCLQNFADRHRVELAPGRGGEAMSWRQARDNSNHHFVTIAGRAVLDGIELLRSATYSFENFSLEFVARQLLGRGKLVDDVDQRGAEITVLFHDNKPALARYNLEDCRLVWDIFTQEKLLEYAAQRSRLTGLELDRYGGSVAALDYLYLPRLHRQGFVAPSPGQARNTAISPGGYVMDSVPGIHDHVAVLDFKSLYPSIIRTFHVDPLALVCGPREADSVPGFEGAQFSRQQHILPELIESLWSARDQAKKDGKKEVSQAIKIIMNSFYGVLGTSGCRFLDSRLVSSITRRGHQIILDSKAQLESLGYQVIYGDTDSVFVLIGTGGGTSARDVAGSQAIAAELASSLNRWWRDRLQNELGLTSFLEMEFETLFERFFMPTIRGADTGSKKRYAGLLPGGKIVFKGLESVRSDWSPLAREFQKELYRRVFADEPCREYIQSLVADLRDGRFEAELVLRKRLRRRLDEYVRNVPPHVQAARKAEAIREVRNLPSLYAAGGWIEYVMTVSGPEPRQYRQSPIDHDFYIDKQLAPIADAILVFQGQSLEQILTQQIGLF